MNSERFRSITSRYKGLRIAIVGDFCLDRYLEIDATKKEVSIETGLPVYNVMRVRSQPGAAGTILNNLVALGVQTIYPVGFAGEDGEGFELHRCLASRPGVRLDHFFQTELRRTFTYTKPLLMEPGKLPVELNRLDSKNWSPTPAEVRERIQRAIYGLSPRVDALIVLDQVDHRDTGVVTGEVLDAVNTVAKSRPDLFMIADSRRSLKGFPPVSFKMNKAEFKALTSTPGEFGLEAMKSTAVQLAQSHGRPVFVTLAEQGILGAGSDGTVEVVPALPVRGPIDIVGAGDSVTANLAAAFSAGATLREGLELAMVAASVVVHQVGTTGTSTISQLAALLPQTA